MVAFLSWPLVVLVVVVMMMVLAGPTSCGAAGIASDQATDATKVFYNRVPKAASTALRSIISDLARHKRNLKFVSSKVYDDRKRWSREEERANAERINFVFETNFDQHVIYDQHVRYINFTQFGLQQPVYINMVREPAARIVSSYYFARTGDSSKREQVRRKLGEQADWSVDECLAHGDNCTFARNMGGNLMTKFFCGHADVCNRVGPAALEQALYNLEHNYAVVGITERFDDTLALLEATLPHIFRGAVRLRERHGIKKSNRNTRAGPTPNAETIAAIRHSARYDVALYDRAVDLFERRLRKAQQQQQQQQQEQPLKRPSRPRDYDDDD
ncbi:hypothetical protein PTSG_01658 [Salpingoeca rosetta]|uniref:Heparan sulfate 2-O-sulfotransferase pipe n=1 Tax=Salpingoeca rosetta (strain ATCC 50818 / BSB-021) TaxID=946362 RepID=F2TYK5_SALR5|nr:uncharacterized protein PTSG_01658 [Salpingoeca rosetta]EGD78679.1 hypothetical protein PTSG_01658 [Salpingoeca rosetta]|eukprot:XP_004997636.1 hypothetical protein PTSG_01658 [Salpingoeca rosetta]